MPTKMPQIVLTTEDPAADTDIAYTIVEDVIIELVNFVTEIVCDAGVANRYLVLTITRDSKVIFALGNPTAITASQTVSVNWGKGLPIGTSGLFQTCPLPFEFRLLKDDIVGVTIVARETGDDIGAGVGTGFKFLK